MPLLESELLVTQIRNPLLQVVLEIFQFLGCGAVRQAFVCLEVDVPSPLLEDSSR